MSHNFIEKRVYGPWKKPVKQPDNSIYHEFLSEHPDFHASITCSNPNNFDHLFIRHRTIDTGNHFDLEEAKKYIEKEYNLHFDLECAKKFVEKEHKRKLIDAQISEAVKFVKHSYLEAISERN